MRNFPNIQDGDNNEPNDPDALRWPNENLAIEVRSAFIRKGWRTIEEAHRATKISINILVNLRHGRSVHPNNLIKFAEAVDGADAIDKWLKIANTRKKLSDNLEKVDDTIHKTTSGQKTDEILANMRNYTSRETMAIQLVTSVLADRINPSNQFYEYVEFLSNFLRPAPITFTSLNPAPSILTLAYLGPDAPGLISLLTNVVASVSGHILQLDSTFRSRFGMVYISFYTFSEHAEESLKAAKTEMSDSIESLIGTTDKTAYILLSKREKFVNKTVYIFNGMIKYHESSDNLSRILERVKDSGFNVINLIQRPDEEDKQKDSALPRDSRVFLFFEPTFLDSGNLKKYRDEVVIMEHEIKQFSFVTACALSDAGETFYATEYQTS